MQRYHSVRTIRTIRKRLKMYMLNHFGMCYCSDGDSHHNQSQYESKVKRFGEFFNYHKFLNACSICCFCPLCCGRLSILNKSKSNKEKCVCSRCKARAKHFNRPRFMNRKHRLTRQELSEALKFFEELQELVPRKFKRYCRSVSRSTFKRNMQVILPYELYR